MEGIMMGIRRELIDEGLNIETDREGLVIGRVKWGGERWRIIGVYTKKEEMKKTLGELERWAEEKEEEVLTTVGIAFNVRTESEGGGVGMIHKWRERERERRREGD